MDLRKLKKLIDLVEESGISELELTEGEEKVRISRNLPQGQNVVYAQAAPMMHQAPAAAPAVAAPAAGAVVAPAAGAVVAPAAGAVAGAAAGAVGAAGSA